MRQILLLLLTLALSLSAVAQEITISGSVTDTDGAPLPGAIIELRHPEAKRSEYYAAAKRDGSFSLRLRAHGPRLLLEVGFVGYKTLTREIEAKDQTLHLRLEESTVELREVTVKAPRVTARRDTITYHVAQIKGESDYALEDVLKRLPGVTVDAEGLISYQGKPINKLYIEDLDLLGGRYGLATRNIRADDVASVQVYEHHQPLKVLQGVEQSEAAALNIRLKESARRRPIGYATVGSGYGPGMLYRGELFGLVVGDGTQHLLTLKGNNEGDPYRFETSSHIRSVSAPRAPGSDLLSGDPLGTPSISEDRYVRNHSGLLSYNGITRLSSGATLGLRAMGDLHRIRYSQGSESTFATPEGPLGLTEREESDRRMGHASVELHYEDNQSTRYVGNTLIADIDRGEDHFVLSGDAPATQRVSRAFGTITNGLTLTRRTDERISTISSVLSYGSTPLLTLSADTREQSQRIRADHFYTHEEGAREWQLSTRSYIGAGADFTATLQRLETEYTERAQMRGADVRTRLTPYYRYSYGPLIGRITVPLTWSYLSYREEVSGRGDRYSRLLPELSASLQYRSGPGRSASLSLMTSESYGSLESFLTTPILSSYRTTYIPGTGTPSRRRSITLGGSGRYRDPFRDFFADLRLSAGRSVTNRLTDQSISVESELSEQVERESVGYNWSALSDIAKGIPDLDLLLKLQTGYLGASHTLLRSGQPLRLETHALMSTLTVMNDFWDRRITGQLRLSYGTTLRRGAEDIVRLLPPRMERYEVRYDLSVTPITPLTLSLNAGYNFLRVIGRSHMGDLHLGAEARYRSKRWELLLELANLTNRHQYRMSQSSGADNRTYYYDLRPLEVRLSLKYNY